MQNQITDPVQVVARTAWGEARGEGVRGMRAVMNVIANRAATPCWWGRDYLTVCLKAWQFSCWNENDPNRPKLLSVTGTDPQFRDALDLAAQLISRKLPDITQGSDHYFDTRTKTPAWADSNAYRCTIGHHAFYRLGPYGQEKDNG